MKKACLLFVFYFILFTSKSQLNIDSLSHIDYQQLHEANLNDVWGYVDELGNEYAIVGTSKGTSIVNVTNPSSPFEVFWLPGSESIWRDPCVYGNYAYVTTEAEDGLQIIDLTPLPQSTNLNSTLYIGPIGFSWQSAHTCFVDENGFAYIFGANRGNGGTIILDVHTNPMNPIEVGQFDTWYIHDGYVRNDTLYAAHIYDGFYSIIDVTTKSNPILLGTQTTPSSFTHNIWPSPNGQYVFTTDEVSGSYITVYDISNPSNMIEVDRTQHSPGLGVVPHNTHVMGDYLITSYYSDGVVIHDITHPNNIIKVGQYDTYPGQTIGFDGCWGVYPFLPSGTILAADITKGLFILGPTYEKASYLEGLVTDINTNLPLSNVKVQLVGNDQIEKTTLNGFYATGILGTGMYSITFNKVGYYPKTEIVDLVQGDVINLQTQLIPIPPFNLNIQVVESGTLIPIPNAQIKLIHPEIEHQGITNALGQESMTLYYQDGQSYQIMVGKWSFVTSCNDSSITENTISLTIELEKGYFDDFEFDFGWIESGDAETGKWERGIPNPTNNTMIGQDAPYDCGAIGYVTGNDPNLNPIFDDVHNGYTKLTSPQMDLTSLSNPHINFASAFYCFYGPGIVDDTLKIILSNGTNQVIIDQIGGPQNELMTYSYKSIPISGLIPINSTMQLSLYVSDFTPNNNVTEAAFDHFSVTNFSTNDLTETDRKLYRIYPNPSSDYFIIDGITEDVNFQLFTTEGTLLLDSYLSEKNNQLDISTFPKGLYVMTIGNQILKVMKY